MHGLSSFWKMLPLVERDNVFDDVANTLIMLHSRFTTRLTASVDDISRTFLGALFDLLKEAASAVAANRTLPLLCVLFHLSYVVLAALNERASRTANRLVKMLKRFLTQTVKAPELVTDDRVRAFSFSPF